MYLLQMTRPAVEPVMLTEMKAHMRVEIADDDALISGMIQAAREIVEAWTRRQIVAASWKLGLDGFEDTITLPRPPLISVDGITYVDVDGTAQPLAATVYKVDIGSDPGRIVRAYGQSWPSVRTEIHAVLISYTAGYAARFTANATTDVVTFTNRTPITGETIELTNLDGALPAGLAAKTTYYVRDVSGLTCKLYLTASGGTAIDITGAGTGTHFVGDMPEALRMAIKLLVADMYEHREAQQDARVEANPTVERLLWPYRILEFW